MTKLLLFFCCFFASEVFASRALHKMVDLYPGYGERPAFTLDLLDQWRQDYLTPYLLPSPIQSLEQWAKNELLLEHDCPGTVLREYAEAQRFYFRLLALSYLFETLVLNEDFIRKTDEEEKSQGLCFNNHDPWWQQLGQKKELSHAMKLVAKRLPIVAKTVKFYLPMGHGPKQYHKLWKSDLENHRFNHPALYFMIPESSWSNQKAQITGACHAMKNQMEKILTETDRFYGLSQFSEAPDLLSNSHVAKYLAPFAQVKFCINRYQSSLAAREEKTDIPWGKVFSLSFKQLLTSNETKFLQGRPFLAGSLKEFEDKGVLAFYQENSKDERPVTPVSVAPIVKEKLPSVIEIKKNDPVILPVVPVSPVVIPEIKVKVFSAFEQAYDDLLQYQLSKAKIDMVKMKYEKVYSPLELQDLSIGLLPFLSRHKLEEMKRLDFLGTRKAPVPLSLLKFLLDQNLHQHLFNLQGILGERFYVINDIEGKTAVVYTEIINNQTTYGQWQVSLIKDSIK